MFVPDQKAPPVGRLDRFGSRWRLVGAGLSNVWRFGDLEMPAPSGRLLMRGPNGTGKTTALEGLWPYLLDLNAARLAAGKARPTTLALLMREGAAGKRRYGYVWITLAGIGDVDLWSFGVRLQYSEDASPQVRVVPFTAPGRPLRDFALYGPARSSLSHEQFTEAVESVGGQVFLDEDSYVAHVAARLWQVKATEVSLLASRLRDVRNPTHLSEVSPQGAAAALRASLPGVAPDVITATAEALAESDATREAFSRDSEAAAILAGFADIWASHAVEVAMRMHEAATHAAGEVDARQAELRRKRAAHIRADREAIGAAATYEQLKVAKNQAEARLRALERSEAYRAAGRLGDLEQTLVAQRAAAHASVNELAASARAAADWGRALRRRLHELSDDFEEQTSAARASDSEAALDSPLLGWTDRPRGPLRVGDTSADPGPGLRLDADAARVVRTAERWRAIASAHQQRASDAMIALTDHKPVAAKEDESRLAAGTAKQARANAETEQQVARRASRTAAEVGGVLHADIERWSAQNPQLREPTAEEGGWEVDDVRSLAGSESGLLLSAADGWAEHATHRAAEVAATARSAARERVASALDLRKEAGGLRAEAARLRAGDLLPLPRPDWAGPGDDSVAFGSALDWAAGTSDPIRRALLESALAACGLLGATLHAGGATTAAWSVSATGPQVTPNLADLLVVDPDHALAETAAAVLVRVQLVPTTDSAAEWPALVVGRDGTFGAGVLAGRAPGADIPAQLPKATHVGARQRRLAALARAQELEERASDCEAHANHLDGEAAGLRSRADEIERYARSFPDRRRLRSAESARAAAARQAAQRDEKAKAAEDQAVALEQEFRADQTAWALRTRARGLPADVGALVNLRDDGQRIAGQLNAASAVLGEKLAGRLAGLLADVDTDARWAAELTGLQAAAQAAQGLAVGTAAEVATLTTTAGASIERVLEEHRLAGEEDRRLTEQVNPALERKMETSGACERASEAVEHAMRTVEETEPLAAKALQQLRQLLAVPGVVEAVLKGAEPRDDPELLGQVAAALARRRTAARKTVREHYDEARAKLAGVWSLDPADGYGDLDTYVLTYQDETYTPAQAAARATILAEKAERALAAAEEKALRDFVIGRLPAAIGAAWTRMHDWIRDANKKMRSASASSRVGVQVRIELSKELSPAGRTTYELSCKVADADRTAEQQAAVGDALQALLAAAEGESIHERLTHSVDVRDWVDLHYEVTRPGAKPARWNSRTGLSGGERRLVVLAPMLAAVAAAYDRLGSTGLRLAALDEVPAEVDERGREGLARYLAQLDLDLICTSHLWDGSPGAWDGIDAHDLEMGPDGTVVGFPMLVRGLAALPGDEPVPAP